MTRQALDILTESKALATQITPAFGDHRYVEIPESMPAIGPLLSAEFIAATGGDMELIGSANRLAGLSGLAPLPPRFCTRQRQPFTGPRRYDRRLMRDYTCAAQRSMRSSPEPDAYYHRKRAEGKRHAQAVIGLAHRRANILWAILRDNNPYAATGSEAIAA